MDVTGAYLNAELKKRSLMRLDPSLAEILKRVDSTYGDYLQKDGSIVVELKKALYGLAESAKLWNETLIQFFLELGFKQNGKDPCVLNVDYKGSQLTVVIYVDDILCTFSKEDAMDWIFEKVLARFKEASISKGPKISYLGQTFNFSSEGKVKVTMEAFVADFLSYCGATGGAVTPAKEDLFVVDENALELSFAEKEEFHSRVAKLLYLSIRVRPDLLTAVCFLCTRVSKPTIQDQEKLDRVVKYLNSTQEMGIVLEGSERLQVVAYIDAAYAVHKDFKSHTGGVITIGKGPVFARSSKQKLVSKSSTEAEIIGTSDHLSQVIWTRDFLLEQGYNVPAAVIKQDNQSAKHMMEAGSGSSENTRHIGIRFFFVKDRITSGEVKIEWLPTEDMLADMLTKPLQGELFRTLRRCLLNWE